MSAVLALAAAGFLGLALHTAGGWRGLAARLAGRALSAAMPPQKAAGGAPPIPVAAQEPFSVLVMGITAGDVEAATDSMMVMSYDPQAKTASLLSVPRDLWVDVPGYGQARIDTAYAYGGVPTTELTVEKVLGIPVEYYALVNYSAFVNLVNLLAGVNVVVPPGVSGKGIYDSTYPNAAENANTLFVLPAGPQHLDGATALKFIRERHSFATGDIQRQQDQQQVLLSLKTELAEPKNWPKLPAAIRTVLGGVETNVPYAEIPLLANQVLQLSKSSVQHAVFQYPTVKDWTTPGQADVLLGNTGDMRSIVRHTFPGLLAAMDGLTVQVENGAPTQQPLATYFTQVLDGMGVHTLPAEQAPQTTHQGNEVYVNTSVDRGGRGQPAPVEASILAQMLGTTVQRRAVPASSADITVILGSDFPPVQQG